MSHKYGIVQYLGFHEKDKCGYCRSETPNFNTHGMWAYHLNANGYQLLIDRGWRRSGMYCYKPFMQNSCCPAYTIRCEALHFLPSKSQKKIMKRISDFINFNTVPKSRETLLVQRQSDSMNENNLNIKASSINTNIDTVSLNMPTQSTRIDQGSYSKFDVNQSSDVQLVPLSEDDLKKKYQHATSKCTKAKVVRLERKLSKLASKLNCDQESAFEIIRKAHLEKLAKQKQKLTLEYRLHQTTVDSPKHKLQTKIVPSNDPKTIQAAHQLFQKYQLRVHKDDEDGVTFKRFKNFLVDNPFWEQDFPAKDGQIFEEEEEGQEGQSNIPRKYGGYFMQYWIDDKLIGVGVIDILVECVSSVYFFYDPEYDFLSLGVYSALREIDLVRQLNRVNPQIKYYYMGYYIHHIQKMKYKANYNPSFLLCPETYQFQPIENCLPKLDKNKYSRLNADKQAQDDDLDFDLTDVLILCQRTVYPFDQYQLLFMKKRSEQQNASDREMLEEFCRLVGKRSLKELIYYSNL